MHSSILRYLFFLILAVSFLHSWHDWVTFLNFSLFMCLRLPPTWRLLIIWFHFFLTSCVKRKTLFLTTSLTVFFFPPCIWSSPSLPIWVKQCLQIVFKFWITALRPWWEASGSRELHLRVSLWVLRYILFLKIICKCFLNPVCCPVL